MDFDTLTIIWTLPDGREFIRDELRKVHVPKHPTMNGRYKVLGPTGINKLYIPLEFRANTGGDGEVIVEGWHNDLHTYTVHHGTSNQTT